MDLTISIAVYNGEKYIDRCLSSIIKAHKKINSNDIKLSILAINDGSSDNSEKILNNYSKKYPIIKVINKKNGGLSSVRNISIDLCESEYLWFIDVDDEIDINSLLYLSKQHLGNINIFNYSTYSYKEDFLFNNYAVTDNSVYETILDNVSLLTQNSASWHYVFNTTFLRKVNIKFLDNILYEDLNWIIKVWPHAKNIHTFNKSIYRYYLTDNSIMRNTNLSKRMDIFRVFDDIIKYYKSRSILQQYFSEIEYLLIHNLLYVGYLSVFQIDKSSNLLSLYTNYLNNYSKNWNKNVYFLKLPVKRRILLYCIKYNLKSIISIIIKLSR